jgi:hypothetical protein
MGGVVAPHVAAIAHRRAEIAVAVVALGARVIEVEVVADLVGVRGGAVPNVAGDPYAAIAVATHVAHPTPTTDATFWRDVDLVLVIFEADA